MITKHSKAVSKYRNNIKKVSLSFPAFGLLHHLSMQVGTARGALEQGVNELVVAKQYQKSSRRWMCWVALVVLIIIAVIVIAVVIAVKH